MQTMNKLVAFMAMAMLSVSALADKPPRQGFYISPEISNVTVKEYCKVVRTLPRIGSLVTTCADSEISFGLFGGYQFNDFIAAEAGIRIGHGFRFTVDAINYKRDLDYSSFSLGGAGRYPISERVAIIGTLGIHFWDVDGSESRAGSDSVNVNIGDDTDFYFGGGLEFMITDNIKFRAEYTRYKLDDDDGRDGPIDYDVDVISTRLVIPF